ncbi:hypothetical protein [Nocardia australiensis]|uniref:hypothetical protein n=1 Tax=Nocardia australiensis TaxID=2887191 RepID=UPI001D14F2DE|nr:hypothetical protein [Nocardia australiensis]
MAAKYVLEYDRTSLVNFRDFEFDAGSSHCYQWIDVKRFNISEPESDDRAILAALVDSIQFRDDYIGGGVDPKGTRHGPYWRNRIDSDKYDPADTATAVDLLKRWTTRCGNIPPALQDAIEKQVLDPIRRSTSRYILGKLDGSAVNDYGFIHTEFHELFLIDRVSNSTLLVVAADD